MIRWLRPEFQNRNGTAAEQTTIDVPDVDDAKSAKKAKPAMAAKADWPKTLAEQARAVRLVLAGGSGATAAAMAKAVFKGAKVDRVEETLDTLGQALRDGAGLHRLYIASHARRRSAFALERATSANPKKSGFPSRNRGLHQPHDDF